MDAVSVRHIFKSDPLPNRYASRLIVLLAVRSIVVALMLKVKGRTLSIGGKYNFATAVELKPIQRGKRDAAASELE